ncbi:MAG: PilN domain-containing protein [Bdellovibrionales bacterium]|nr:PilN domain-containing protein [Bdellovibrionales bacterium]
MIKINLHHRKAAVGVSAGSATGASGVGGIKGFIEKMRGAGAGVDGISDGEKRSLIILVVVYAAILGGGWWYLGEKKTELLGDLDTEVAALDSKIQLLTSELNKTSGYEKIKKSLESDEKTIRTKISTIQELIRDRSTPPKILMTLSESIPKEVWLREFSLQSRHFRILGSCTGMDVVSDFMKALEETIYFKGVVLRSSRQDTAKGGHVTASFELEADRR